MWLTVLNYDKNLFESVSSRVGNSRIDPPLRHFRKSQTQKSWLKTPFRKLPTYHSGFYFRKSFPIHDHFSSYEFSYDVIDRDSRLFAKMVFLSLPKWHKHFCSAFFTVGYCLYSQEILAWKMYYWKEMIK